MLMNSMRIALICAAGMLNISAQRCQNPAEEELSALIKVVAESGRFARDTLVSTVGCHCAGFFSAMPLCMLFGIVAPLSPEDACFLALIPTAAVGAIVASHSDRRTSLGTRLGGIIAVLSSMVGLSYYC